jgi:hypothetical protein
MFLIIWSYTVHANHLNTFIEYYHRAGVWVNFFQPSPHYLGTDFFQTENENQFITIDTWTSEQAYRNYIADNKKQYDELDKQCEGFTVEEALVDTFYLM